MSLIIETDLLNGSHEILKVYSPTIHDVEVLKHLHEASLLCELVIRLLQKFVLKFFLKPFTSRINESFRLLLLELQWMRANSRSRSR
jgi:hypothetical protein